MKGFCTTVGGLLVKGFFTVIRGVMKVAQEVIKVVMDAAVSVLDSLTLDQLSFSGDISDTGGGSTTRTISSTIKFTFAGKQTSLSLPLTVGLDSFETTLKGIWESIKKDVADLSNLLPKAERALVDATKVDTKGIQKVVKCIESAANGDVFGDACGTLKTVRLNTFDGLNILISQQHCPNFHKPTCSLPFLVFAQTHICCVFNCTTVCICSWQELEGFTKKLFKKKQTAANPSASGITTCATNVGTDLDALKQLLGDGVLKIPSPEEMANAVAGEWVH